MLAAIQFEKPLMLLLALVAVPLVLLGWFLLRTMDPLRRTVSLAMRAGLLLLVALMLAEPHAVREHDHLTVIGLLDVSDSVRRFVTLPEMEELANPSTIGALRDWFRAATETRAPDDRFGLIVFDGQAAAISVPSAGRYLDQDLDVRMLEGTNMAQAISLGLAMLPGDTAKRLVLVSDGNQTIGDALEIARQGRRGSDHIPIDVVPLEYEVKRDVQIVRVEAPPAARSGQTVTIRMLLEATTATPGRLTLLQEELPVDLNGAEPGTSRRVQVPAGPSVHLAQVVLVDQPVNRFEVIFEADDPQADLLPENNQGAAFTVTPSRGKVLIVNDAGGDSTSPLAQLLSDADIPVVVLQPEQVTDDLLSLQQYDLIVLDNVTASLFSVPQQELLSRAVHDLGVGLIMIGGRRSFGAGGWNGTQVEAVLPVELDPPRQLRLPTTALVLVLDKSGSMKRRVAGARATQQQVANEAAALAIESLRSDALIGVVTFDAFAREWVPLQRVDEAGAIANRVRGIVAEGGTDLKPALAKAYRMLANVDVQQKKVVCLTDGESPTEGLEQLVASMARDNIQLTTIAVGDEADEETLRRLAEIGGGRFYPVRNPRTLPRVLVDSVQVVNEPLLKEGLFKPVVRPTGSTLTLGMDEAPPLGGLVITAPRDDPSVIIEAVHPEGEPLLVHWQAGLGRSAAFTSDALGPWSASWLDWPRARPFWTQLVRTMSRPTADLQTELRSVIEDDALDVTLEASGTDDGFLNYLQVDGTVYGPDGRGLPIRLRQTAPGRYEGAVPAEVSGNYIVALSPRRGLQRLAPVIGGANKTSSPEFRRYRSNVAVLDRIAEATGGRRLNPADPRAIDLFDRTGMPRSVSSLPAWRLILWAALALLLLDIASRRLAWSADQLRNALRASLARVAPASVRGRRVEATLGSLRQAGDRVEQRLSRDSTLDPETPARSALRDGSAATGRNAAMEGEAPTPAPERRPDPAKVAAALDALRGAGPPKKVSAPPEPEPPEPSQSPQVTTSQLLAARRRAQQRLQSGDSGGDEEPGPRP